MNSIFRNFRTGLWRSCLIKSVLVLAIFACIDTSVFGDNPVSVVKAAKNKNRIKVLLSSDAVSGIAKLDDPVTFTAEINNRGATTVNGKLDWSVKSPVLKKSLHTSTKFSIGAKKTQSLTFTITLRQAGFAEVECAFIDSQTEQSVSSRLRIGCQPNRVVSSLTRQNDFAEFWKKATSELRDIPPAFESIERVDLSDERIRVFEVKMRSHDQIRVSGWLEVPRKSTQPLPAVIRVPGYGQNMRPTGKWDDMVVFSFNPRGHGNSQQDIPGKPTNFWIRGLDDQQTYYYKGSYLDCIRAVDFIASRSDVDPAKIAVWGGSQGGGFAIATAALDSRVDYCVADIPFLCDWSNYFRLTHWPEMDAWIADRPDRNWNSTLQTLSYFDTLNLADRVRCPTIMSVGLQDQICPPTTCFAVFNRIIGEKRYRIYPEKKHGLGHEHHTWVWQELRSAFGLTD